MRDDGTLGVPATTFATESTTATSGPCGAATTDDVTWSLNVKTRTLGYEGYGSMRNYGEKRNKKNLITLKIMKL